jgi:hypothetical protein
LTDDSEVNSKLSPQASRPRGEFRCLAGLAIIVVLVATYYSYTWRSYVAFATSLDTCGRLFCDFVTYYFPMGASIFKTPLPLPGFVYSPFSALLISGFAPLGLTSALWIWGILEVLSIILYVLLFRRLVPASLPIQLVFVAIALTSFPVLHNLPWGQVGIITTVAILALLALYQRGSLLAASGALALAVSFKFFPLIFLLPFVFRRDLRFVLLALAVCSTCLLLVPATFLGIGATIGFYKALIESYGEMTWVLTNYNSQHFPHVAHRVATAAGLSLSPILSRGSSFVVAAANFAFVLAIQKKRLPHADLFSFLILFLTVPFILYTSWPTDLAFLPFAQGLLLWWTFQQNGRSGLVQNSPSGTSRRRFASTRLSIRKTVAAITLLLSIALSSIAFFNFVGDPIEYGYAGFVFLADLLLLIVVYIELLPSLSPPWKASSAA